MISTTPGETLSRVAPNVLINPCLAKLALTRFCCSSGDIYRRSQLSRFEPKRSLDPQPIALVSNRKSIQWNRYPQLEAAPLPVVLDLASKLTNDAAFGKNATKAESAWTDNNHGTTGLLPLKTEFITLRLPLDVDRAIRFRKCSVFDCICRGLMERQGKALTAVTPTITSGPLALMRSREVSSS